MLRGNLVIDVNIFLASLFFDSKICNKVLDSVKDEIFVLLSCDEFVDETSRKVDFFLQKRPQTQISEINFWLKYIQNTAKYIQLTSSLKICRGQKTIIWST